MSEVKTNKISSLASNNDITIDPDGTGNTIIASGEVGVGTTTPATFTDFVSGSNAPSVVVAGSQPSYVLADTDISGNDGTLGITKAGEDTVINNLGAGNVRISNNGAERMRIDSSGFIGIGTSAPKKKFHIQDTTSDGIIILDRNGTSTDHQICFAHNYQSGSQTGGNYYAIGVDDSANKLVFAYDSNSQASLSADAKMTLDSSGFFGVGIASPNASLHVQGTSTNDNLGATYINNQNSADAACVASFATAASGTSTSNVILRFGSNNYAAGQGMIVANGGGAVTFASFSDRALKENIADLPLQLDKILALRPVEFDYIEDQGGDHQIGFIAQEVEEIYPDLVGENEDGIKMLGGFDKTTARLVKALQEAVAKIEALETRVAAQEAGE